MALSKVNYNSLNVTPSASKFLAWDSDADALAAADIGGSLTLISTLTADNSGTNLSFTSGIDSTYKEYIFKFINIHTASGDNRLLFNMSIDGGSNYNVTKTSTFFETYVEEDGTDSQLTYATARDLAQSTADQRMTHDQGDGNDESSCGFLHLFNPSSTTFVKHWIAEYNNASHYDYAYRTFIAGYGNTTSAVNAVTFKAHSGNLESGSIKMYGVS